MAMIRLVEEFFSRGCGRCARFDTPACSALNWAEGLAALRDLLLATGMSETAKWGHPCYMHAGRNVAILGVTRGDFRLIFFEAGLLGNTGGLLERQGPNTRHPDMIRFTAAAEVAARSAAIDAYLREAMAHAAAGRRALPETQAPDWPDGLTEALDLDPDLSAAFHRLTPGRRKSWLHHLAATSSSATRAARLARARPRILAGLGANDRFTPTPPPEASPQSFPDAAGQP